MSRERGIASGLTLSWRPEGPCHPPAPGLGQALQGAAPASGCRALILSPRVSLIPEAPWQPCEPLPAPLGGIGAASQAPVLHPRGSCRAEDTQGRAVTPGWCLSPGTGLGARRAGRASSASSLLLRQEPEATCRGTSLLEDNEAPSTSRCPVGSDEWCQGASEKLLAAREPGALGPGCGYEEMRACGPAPVLSGSSRTGSWSLQGQEGGGQPGALSSACPCTSRAWGKQELALSSSTRGAGRA